VHATQHPRRRVNGAAAQVAPDQVGEPPEAPGPQRGQRTTGQRTTGQRTAGQGTAGQRTAWLGIAGAVAAFTVLALLQVWTIPIYQPPDEASHVGYGVMLANGDGLPTIDTPIPTSGEPRRAAWTQARDPLRRTIWTANHPPLYYALAALPLGLGERGGHALGGVRAARVLSVALAAAGLLLLGWVLLQLFPALPGLAVAATGMAALVPTFVASSSLVYNDAVAFLTTTATLAAATVFLLRGPNWARLAAVAASASAAALSRASGLLAVGIAGLAVLVGVWRAGGIGSQRRLGRAIAWAVLVGVAVVASSGWFYLRNFELYGSITGMEALLERLQRPPRGSVLDAFVSPSFWADQQMRLWNVTFNPPSSDANGFRWVWTLCFVPALGLLLAAVRWLAREPRRWRVAPPRLSGRMVALALWLLLLVLLEYSVAQFNSAGGNPHVRYLFPGIGAIGLLLALGVAALPGGRGRGLPALAMLAVLAAVNIWGWLLLLGDYLRPADGRSPLAAAFESAGVGRPAVLLVPAGIALAAALGLLGRSIWALAPLDAPYQARGGTTLPASADDLGTVTSSPDLVRTTKPEGSTFSS
jgi:4-amino-4-deoxy-L-arabinose transferase-like glycosyltransferase